MNTQRSNALLACLTLILTACGSSSLPTGLSTASQSTSNDTGTALMLSTNGLTSAYTNGTLQLFPSGGVLPYTLTASAGSVDKNTFIFTAPATAQNVTITLTDKNGTKVTAPVNVVAQQTTPPPSNTTPPPPAPTSKIIFQFYNDQLQQHIFSDQLADSQGGRLVGPAYRLAINNDAGTVPYYRCTLAIPGYQTMFVDTIDPNCEGYQHSQVYKLGFIYTAQNSTNSLVRLYRWRIDFVSQTSFQYVTDHIDQIQDQAPAAGWQKDNVVLYTPAQ